MGAVNSRITAKSPLVKLLQPCFCRQMFVRLGTAMGKGLGSSLYWEGSSTHSVIAA